jgi:GNAT superfamily N-acetyltransferase
VMDYVEQVHHSAVPGPHWYLPLIGVEPSRQGHGVGVLQAMLPRVDREGLSCYLETFQPTNVRFYQRNGFEIAAEGRESESGLLYWAFKRLPARANSGLQPTVEDGGGCLPKPWLRSCRTALACS